MRRRPRRRPPYVPPRESCRLYLALPSSGVALFRFLLEGYGHLGCMTVVDRYAAVIRLMYAPGARREVLCFLDAAAGEIPGLTVRLDCAAEAAGPCPAP